MFTNREEAGDRLVPPLKQYQDDPAGLILALPRGGVAVGYRLSLALHLPLDVFITRKLGAPGNPEFAMGAITETGSVYLNQEAIRELGIPEHAIEKEAETQREEIRRRQKLYRKGGERASVSGRNVILVDDGVATGSTYLASIEALRRLNPARLIGALPVGPAETMARIRRLIDELVVLETPSPFYAVGEHYHEFSQIEDQEVISYLTAASEALRGGHP